MTESSESGAGKIALKIKTTAVQYDVEVPEGATVGDVKHALVDKTGNSVEKHTLIFSGKILKDAETLAQHSIKDGMAIHLVIRTPAPAVPAPAHSAAPTAAAPAPAAPSTPSQQQRPSPFGGLSGMGAAPAAGGMNPMAMLQNPEMMQQMMNSPIMQSLMSNPQVLRSMLSENPQVQQLIESNPELGHILNDPEMMRQTMEMMRNPNMFNEMMRNHDQAIRNLQGIPGGEAALQRLYQDVQEPLLNSATSSFGGNPFAALSNNANNATSRSQNAGVENAEALPNPWGAGGAATGNAAGAAQGAQGGAARGGAGMGAMMEQMMQAMGGAGGAAGGLGGATGANGIMEMMNNPAMRQMAAQMAQGLASDPATAGLLGGVPPSVLTAMGNPRVIEAMMQIQSGMEVIRTEAPELARDMFGQSAAMMEALGRHAGGAAAPAAGTDGAAAGAAAGGLGGIPPSVLNSLFANMQMGAGMGGGAPAASREQLEAQYASQLEQLQGMGFTNVAENLAALSACFGDVNMAIERLLQR
ncbi:ubql-1 [Pristionchus pacificus]|uniref:Ubql-1 n=1 Tax=Pristionchus pacificus TaxID=54126 RepID=A0A2A6CA11_PRIPA|nr:ubql-1 [Pristionchus pacificus]|eukprot:PDM74861.1 ubql-1 [Pristionchus pacificus]